MFKESHRSPFLLLVLQLNEKTDARTQTCIADPAGSVEASSTSNARVLRIVKILRLLRLFRILKLAKLVL
jgi:hypothetical protein